MINFQDFIKQCERDLVIERKLSNATKLSFDDLSYKHKALCKPILNFVTGGSIEGVFDPKHFIYYPKEYILVCRLIPFMFGLNTNSPTWSSYMLSKAIKAANEISGIKLSEIGTAFLEILCEFKTPLNRIVHNFCIDLSREFTVHYHNRLNELEPLSLWDRSDCDSILSMAYLRYGLSPIDCYHPKFILKTMIALLHNEFFKELIKGTKYLFEDGNYRKSFEACLIAHKLPPKTENLIFNAIT